MERRIDRPAAPSRHSVRTTATGRSPSDTNGSGLGRALAGWSLLATLLCGCGPSIYAVPDPPPRDQWVDLHAEQGESDEARVRRFLDAKRVAIATYTALQQGDWQKALGHMSQETQAFLEDAGDGDAEKTLSTGQLALGGRTTQFDPVNDFFVADLADIVDEFAGQDEVETPRRKELYAVAKSGEARKILFIYEGDDWRFHSPFVKTPTVKAP